MAEPSRGSSECFAKRRSDERTVRSCSHPPARRSLPTRPLIDLYVGRTDSAKMRPANQDRREGRQIDECMGDVAFVGDALARAVADALRMHKRAGNPIAVWKDGQVCWVQPEEI